MSLHPAVLSPAPEATEKVNEPQVMSESAPAPTQPAELIAKPGAPAPLDTASIPAPVIEGPNLDNLLAEIDALAGKPVDATK